jgi:hypothetical protein
VRSSAHLSSTALAAKRFRASSPIYAPPTPTSPSPLSTRPRRPPRPSAMTTSRPSSRAAPPVSLTITVL